MTKQQATLLQKLGRGVYMTRDMAASREVELPKIESPKRVVTAVADELEGMDKDELHELAKSRGVKVHHMAGADKVRAALREAK